MLPNREFERLKNITPSFEMKTALSTKKKKKE